MSLAKTPKSYFTLLFKRILSFSFLFQCNVIGILASNESIFNEIRYLISDITNGFFENLDEMTASEFSYYFGGFLAFSTVILIGGCTLIYFANQKISLKHFEESENYRKTIMEKRPVTKESTTPRNMSYRAYYNNFYSPNQYQNDDSSSDSNSLGESMVTVTESSKVTVTDKGDATEDSGFTPREDTEIDTPSTLKDISTADIISKTPSKNTMSSYNSSGYYSSYSIN